jgi:hypothetical protein
MNRSLKSIVALLVLAVSGPAEVLYSEHFSNGTADLAWVSQWGTESNQVVVDFVTGNPSGDGFVGKLGNDLSGGGVGSVYVPDNALQDYSVSVQILLIPGQTHYRGVLGRATGINGETPFTFYSFLAQLGNAGMGGDRFRLRKHGLAPFPGVIHDWSQAEMGALYPTTEGWYEFTLRMEGNQLWCYLNDQLLPGCPFTDADLGSGGPGIYFFDQASTDQFIRFDDLVVDGTATALDPAPLRPAAFELLPAVPNPFNPETRIGFRLDQPARVALAVYNLQGAKVRELADRAWPAGEHALVFDGRNALGQPLASGTYLLALDSPGGRQSRLLTLLK